MEKLNLKWVSDSIGNDYKKWKPGDTVLISAQTGTGKTWFIKNVLLDNIGEHKHVLLVCNRVSLKRQLKKDLLYKYGLDVPDNLETLDEITKIDDRIYITSYQAISNNIKDEMYGTSSNKQLSSYDYIIFDECHFIFADGGFNNKNRFAYQELIRQHFPHSVKVFISATMNEIESPIINCVNNNKEKGFGLDEIKIHKYSTGIDYSYVKPKYFDQLSKIINLIKNDKTDDKWMVFVSSIEKEAKVILREFGENASLIKSGTKDNAELDRIINNSKFNKKILVCTKALDNGINIHDPKLTNMVIMSWDEISFIQMLGRKRIDIENPEKVNLYIPMRYKNSFSSKLYGCRQKEKEVKLFMSDKNEFNKKYDNDLKHFSQLNELFYREKDGAYNINKIGFKRLYSDIEFYEKMIEEFDDKGKYAFIHKQLSWLGLSDKKCAVNEVDELILKDEKVVLADLLESMVDKKLFSDDQQKLSDLIINELITISSNVDYRTKKLKPSTLEMIIRDQLSLPYAVSKPKKEGKGEMRGQRYIIISKISN